MKILRWIVKIICCKGRVLFASSLFFLLTACSGVDVTPAEMPEEPVSFITGKTGGVQIAGFGQKDAPINGMPINALIWRAALDIASFVPLDDIDTFGGSIVTEWHQPKTSPGKRLKLAMFVVGQELRSDAIKVRVYVQQRQNSDWVDTGHDEALGRKLENLILARARELRSAALAESVK